MVWCGLKFVVWNYLLLFIEEEVKLCSKKSGWVDKDGNLFFDVFLCKKLIINIIEEKEV